MNSPQATTASFHWPTMVSKHTYFTRKSRKTFLVMLVLVLASGCRTPWSGYSNDPSFERLLELENGKIPTPISNQSPQAHQQVQQRRPGSTAASRFANSEFESNPSARTHLIDSTESEFAMTDDSGEQFSEEDGDAQMNLLQRTQLALKNGSQSSQAAVTTKKTHNATMAAYNSQSEAGNRSTRQTNKRALPAETQDASDRKLEESETIAIRLSDETIDENVVLASAKPSSRSHKGQANPNSIRSNTSPVDSESAVVSASYTATKELQASSNHVRPAKFEKETEVDSRSEQLTWQQHLQEALRQLRASENDSMESPQSQKRREVVARILALALNDRESMLETIKELSPEEQDYFSHQLSAIYDAIDPEANPVNSRKWSLVMLNQRKANLHLAAMSNLEINNINFCTEVIDFGVISPFQTNKFTPDQEVLLYVELDNFTSEKSKDGKGFETQLQGSYEIVDSSGRRVADQLLPVDSHICKNTRRDYFIAYRIYMPNKLSAGSYSLRLTIEDIKGKKFGQSEIQFQIN